MPSTTLSRRELLASAATAGAVAAAGCAGSDGVLDAQRWPQFGYDATNAAHNPDAEGPREEPGVAWVHVGGTYCGGPTVGEHGVYAVDADGRLTSWTRGGRERWSIRVDPPVTGSPVPADGRLYLGTGDGLLYALE